jgi:hypothetical protein
MRKRSWGHATSGWISVWGQVPLRASSCPMEQSWQRAAQVRALHKIFVGQVLTAGRLPKLPRSVSVRQTRVMRGK